MSNATDIMDTTMMINSTHTDMDNSTANATVSVAVAARQLLTYKVSTGVIFIVKANIKC